MIRGIHYFSAEVKTKIDVIPRGCFKNDLVYDIMSVLMHTRHLPTANVNCM